MDHRPELSQETLAAQALDDVDPGSGGLAPVINPATTYEPLPDGSYHKAGPTCGPTTGTYEVAEWLLAAPVLGARPEAEYAAGHIPGALSVRHYQPAAGRAGLPARADIVTYCRIRYRGFAPDAVRLLRARGFSARPLDGGLPDWRLAGLPVTAQASA